MPTWVYIVLFAAVLLAIGFLVDLPARRKRRGLERPASRGTGAPADAGAEAERIMPHSTQGIPPNQWGGAP
jgi:hypothetical protein